MKAESLKERPPYELFKQNDIVSFYHFQLPRWLVEDRRYIELSLEAKFTYTLLFNRFQLSKHNGWINDEGEVFVIYTRKELSERLNVSEKRISAAMNELRDYSLIWERRCGRGYANQIYLANVKTSLEDSLLSKGGPVDPPASVQERNPNVNIPDGSGAAALGKDVRPDETEVLNHPVTPVIAESTSFEAPDGSFKNLQNGGSGTVNPAGQEPPFRLPSYLDLSFKDLSNLNQSQSKSSPYLPRAGTDGIEPGMSDRDALNGLIEKAELETLEEDDAKVMRDAIERLFYSSNIKVGNAVYPNDRIRLNLGRLDAFIVQDAVTKITGNTTVKIRNSSAYVVTVLFNTIMESGSDLLVDPYLNRLRATPKSGNAHREGG